ncbi:MAG: hypothetical protein L0H93_22055 [Nocardioides sp.]|nr:hypothetical protein [Nocardioides sp.]
MLARMEYVEIARAESVRGELVLRERRDDNTRSVLELRANGIFVKDTVETTSERALAAAALAVVVDPRDVLVGGVGLGFTMHEVLADVRVESCTVVEIEPALVDWMRDGTVGHGPKMLADARLSLTVADIGDALAEAPAASCDLVLLDVDNGPGYLVHEENAALYRPEFLTRARAVLRPAGTLVIWAANRAPGLEDALRAVFGNAAETTYDVHMQGREVAYYLYSART